RSDSADRPCGSAAHHRCNARPPGWRRGRATRRRHVRHSHAAGESGIEEEFCLSSPPLESLDLGAQILDLDKDLGWSTGLQLSNTLKTTTMVNRTSVRL